MAVSPRMLALIQKIEAADEQHFARLRERGKQQAEAKERAKKTQAAKKKKPSINNAVNPRTLAIIRRVDAQTDAVNALGKRRERASSAAKRMKKRLS